jgi:hypothetical protein
MFFVVIIFFNYERTKEFSKARIFSKAFKVCRKFMDTVWGGGDLTIKFSSLTFVGKQDFSHDAIAKSNVRFPNNQVVSVGFISVIKKRALRRGIWLRALSRVERGVLDLTVRYVDCIRSTQLAKVVTAILEKLKFASESIVDRLVRTVGFSLAQKISNTAINWGNRHAFTWANDLAFARFLIINDAKYLTTI